MDKPEETALLTPEEQQAAAHVAQIHGSKNYANMSLMLFIIVVLIAYAVNAVMSYLAGFLGLIGSIIWLAAVGLAFYYSYKELGRSNMSMIFLFVISSIIFFGAIGAVVAIVLSGGLIISNLTSMAGVVFAYLKLSEHDAI